ncbi:hypothetical protein H6781_01250 [Candidatus Nomurabacteria bacterium]|nr:hypothetical protein [Candidatus Nomurabacteria bacterium]MCB9818144.1 hypothetical protein [Candidatus Nomurabacteria bacterium]
MNTVNKTHWLSGKNLVVLLIGMLVMYFGVTTMVDKRFAEFETNTRSQITEQLVLVSAISEATSRNGADAVTESIVKDCSVSERIQFDDLLNNLNNNLNRTQLTELERLFGRCGSFYSERKSVMVARLTREVEILEGYVNQLSVILDKDISSEYSLEDWKKLSEEEKKQSELFANLVVLQDEIISTLLSGKNAQSPEIEEILQQVREVQETLLVANAQASALRSRLISL